MPYVMIFARSGRYGRGSGLPINGMLANWDMSGGSGQTVADRSGKGNPLQLGSTSGSDAADPTFTATGLSFGGAQQCRSTGTVASPVTLLAVFQVAGSGTRTLVGSQGALLHFHVNPTGKLEFDKQDAAIIGIGVSTVTGAPFFGAVSYDGTVWKIYKGGALDASGSNAQALGAAPVSVGATNGAYFYSGMIYQVVVYSRVLSDTEVSNAYRNLKSIWAGRGIPI